ncbi:MAG: hypothetical protein PHD76_10000 [Methylacidiphilales bacterium]|nr:hypothetical protein [Candidatus Methylacidiphilales bacterium]
MNQAQATVAGVIRVGAILMIVLMWILLPFYNSHSASSQEATNLFAGDANQKLKALDSIIITTTHIWTAPLIATIGCIIAIVFAPFIASRITARSHEAGNQAPVNSDALSGGQGGH